MEGLGALGFWLGLGIFLGLGAIGGALKERGREPPEVEKERERQTTLRAILQLEAEGKLTPETLAYMRERDAAERELMRAMWGLNWMTSGRSVTAAIFAIVVGVLSFLGGIMALGQAGYSRDQWPIQVGLLLGIWAGGLLIAWLIWLFGRGRKKNDPPAA